MRFEPTSSGTTALDPTTYSTPHHTRIQLKLPILTLLQSSLMLILTLPLTAGRRPWPLTPWQSLPGRRPWPLTPWQSLPNDL